MAPTTQARGPLEQAPLESMAMFVAARQALATKEHLRVRAKRIRPMPNQPRGAHEEDALSGFEFSTKLIGRIQDIIVRHVPKDDRGREFEIIDGEGRWHSALKGNKTLDIVAVTCDDPQVARLIGVISNVHRHEYTLAVRSSEVALLSTTMHLPHKDIARILGIKKSVVEKLHSLQRLPPSVRELFEWDTMHPTRSSDIMVAVSRLEGSTPEETERIQLYWANRAIDEDIVSAVMLNDLMREVKKTEPHKVASPNKKSLTSPGEWTLVIASSRALLKNAERLQKLMKDKKAPDNAPPVHPAQEALANLEKAKKILDEVFAKLPQKRS